jgi:hypothetical protein
MLATLETGVAISILLPADLKHAIFDVLVAMRTHHLATARVEQ